MPKVKFKILNSMPFRLALAFATLYFLCMSIGAAFYYKTVQDYIIGSIDESLTNRQFTVRSVYDEFDLDGLVSLGEMQGNNPMEATMGYHLSSPAGKRLMGNIPRVAEVPGWATIPGSELDLGTDENYRFLTFEVGEHLVSLGRSVQEADDVRKHMLSTFLTAFLGATVLALFGSAILASRSHSRVRSIVSSMDRVASGNLNARLPISSKGDDIDSLSSNMNDALSLLQQQVSGMKQVSADIAHDLKTPLNRLNIKIEEAAACVENGQPVQEKLEEAIEEASNINGTFEALLRISQIEAGARKANFVAMDLLPTLQTAHEVYEAVVEEHDQTIALVLDRSVEENAGLHLLGDKDLLLQMIVNLIENAIRHCPSGTDIVIGAGVDGSCVWMRVCDNGPGIPEKERDKVFQRLYRLESSRTTKGSGLGLSLVKAVADLHCASVDLSDNEPGLCIQINFDLDCPVDF